MAAFLDPQQPGTLRALHRHILVMETLVPIDRDARMLKLHIQHRLAKTKGLMAQRELSQEGVERFLHVLASEGGIHIGDDDYFELSPDERTTVQAEALRKAAKKHCDQYEGRALETHLGVWFHKVGVTRRDVRSRINHTTKHADIAHYVFPPLPEFVANVGGA